MDETETGPLLEPQNVPSRRNRPDTESQARSKVITFCCLILSFVFVAPCLLIIISTSRGVVPPACYIEKLHILPVYGTSNETQVIDGTYVFFDLIFMDMYPWGKIYCENVTMAFYYQGNNLSLPIGNISIPKFVIEKDLPAVLHINQTFGLNAAGIDVKDGSMKMIGITLDTNFRASGWYSDSPRSKIYQMGLQANVTVDDQGMSVEDKVWLSPVFRGDLLSVLQYIALAFTVILMVCLLCFCWGGR